MICFGQFKKVICITYRTIFRRQLPMFPLCLGQEDQQKVAALLQCVGPEYCGAVDEYVVCVRNRLCC